MLNYELYYTTLQEIVFQKKTQVGISRGNGNGNGIPKKVEQNCAHRNSTSKGTQVIQKLLRELFLVLV